MPMHPLKSRLTTLSDRLSARHRRALWILLAGIIIAFPALLGLNERGGGSGKAGFYLAYPVSVAVDKTFTVELHVKTGGAPINAVSAVLTYNPNKLDVVTMTTAPSFCSFYTENSFDTIKGEVRLSCGAPSPGFTGDSTLALINMRAKSVGTSTIGFSRPEARILANDGKGTDLTGTLPNATLTITQSL